MEEKKDKQKPHVTIGTMGHTIGKTDLLKAISEALKKGKINIDLPEVEKKSEEVVWIEDLSNNK